MSKPDEIYELMKKRAESDLPPHILEEYRKSEEAGELRFYYKVEEKK